MAEFLGATTVGRTSTSGFRHVRRQRDGEVIGHSLPHFFYALFFVAALVASQKTTFSLHTRPQGPAVNSQPQTH